MSKKVMKDIHNRNHTTLIHQTCVCTCLTVHNSGISLIILIIIYYNKKSTKVLIFLQYNMQYL